MLINHGAAGGCPQSGTTSTSGTCNNGWTQEDVWWVSWGAAPSYPQPEIYATTGANANQWQQLSLYSVLKHGGRMSILGPLSQYGACQKMGGCSGTDNTSSHAWSFLWSALNGDSRTAQDLRMSTESSRANRTPLYPRAFNGSVPGKI